MLACVVMAFAFQPPPAGKATVPALAEQRLVNRLFSESIGQIWQTDEEPGLAEAQDEVDKLYADGLDHQDYCERCAKIASQDGKSRARLFKWGYARYKEFRITSKYGETPGLMHRLCDQKAPISYRFARMRYLALYVETGASPKLAGVGTRLLAQQPHDYDVQLAMCDKVPLESAIVSLDALIKEYPDNSASYALQSNLALLLSISKHDDMGQLLKYEKIMRRDVLKWLTLEKRPCERARIARCKENLVKLQQNIVTHEQALEHAAGGSRK